MNLTDYLNQINPQRNNHVEVTRAECSHIWDLNELESNVEINFGTLGTFTYRKEKHISVLYSIDQYGKRKSESVFHLID